MLCSSPLVCSVYSGGVRCEPGGKSLMDIGGFPAKLAWEGLGSAASDGNSIAYHSIPIP